jgi:radical SAM superfamily enzyme YgiQ (UPF0313 family)
LQQKILRHKAGKPYFMNYAGNVIRPPSEADAIILQVTVGCSYNKCTFCGAYKDTRFRIKAVETIDADLAFAAKYCRRQRRLFLADGDVLILSQRRLVELFGRIRRALPWIRRVSLYGNARAIRSKSVDQLLQLKSMGLDRIYMGLESGCNEILDMVANGETAATMTAAAEKVTKAQIFLSVTALLGLGGVGLSSRHAVETAGVVNNMAPQQLAVLTLMPLGNTQLGRAVATGAFVLPTPRAILQELRTLVSHLENFRCQFHANHASSYLPLTGRLPRDKDALLRALAMAVNGSAPLVPEYRRAL